MATDTKSEDSLKMWRTLFRVTEVDDDNVWITFPAWDSDESIKYPYYTFPKDLRKKFAVDYRFFGRANIGCRKCKKLNIDGEYEFK